VSNKGTNDAWGIDNISQDERKNMYGGEDNFWSIYKGRLLLFSLSSSSYICLCTYIFIYIYQSPCITASLIQKVCTVWTEIEQNPQLGFLK
jgi:hypothetical protein